MMVRPATLSDFVLESLQPQFNSRLDCEDYDKVRWMAGMDSVYGEAFFYGVWSFIYCIHRFFFFFSFLCCA